MTTQYDKPCATPTELRHHTPGTYSVHYLSCYAGQVMERPAGQDALELLQEDLAEADATLDPAALSGEMVAVCIYEILADRTCILRDRAAAKHR